MRFVGILTGIHTGHSKLKIRRVYSLAWLAIL